ncbi:MAG: hypothetical protein Q9218_007183 [Villophora microphyllina]
MIERAAACLENGGKHILRTPSKPFRTHRSLHSAFWSHGAGDINLPAWWHAFLQVPSDSSQLWGSRDNAVSVHKVASDGAGLGFLDFLYPRRTLAFIHKCMTENATSLRRRKRLQMLSQRSRAYTSKADLSAGDRLDQDKGAGNTTVHPAMEDGTSAGETGEAVPDPKAKLHELLHSEDQSSKMQQLWRLYRQTQESSLPLDPADLNVLFRSLGTSRWTIDLERTRDLLDSIVPSNRRAHHYACAISASLKLDDLKRAVVMHQEAASRLQGSFGSSLAFTYAIERSNWEAALAVWQQYWNKKEVYFGPADIWDGWDAMELSVQMRKAKGAVNHAIQCIEASTFDDAAIARKFATSLVQRTLLVRNKDFKCSVQKTLLERAQSMQPLGFLFYKNAILQNFTIAKSQDTHKHSAWGLRLYRRLRTDLNMVPDTELIDAFLRRAYFVGSRQGVYEVIEDYRKHPEGIPRRAFWMLMSSIARHGDFETVNQLLQEALDRFGTEDLPKYATALLHACFRRADLDRAIGIFESLQEKYDYMPDLRAWNILLRTYSRVGDCDGAMALFDRLVAGKVSPDSSTYAILMGMFAKRSDYEATSMLFERATSEAVKPNIEMVDSLVLAQTTSGRPDEAEETVEEALKMDLEVTSHRAPYLSGDHSRTRMWNTLLSHNAMNGQLQKVSDITKRMQKGQVAFDGITYAALMQAFVIKNKHGLAHRILNIVMPKAKIRATALHYGILMGGYVTRNAHDIVFRLSQRMLGRGLKPTFSTQNPLMRAASKIDEQERPDKLADDGSFEATRAEKVLAQTLDTLNPAELAALGPTKSAQSNPPNIALHASYFPYMISLYGHRKCFEKVAEMYDRFIATTHKFSPNLEASPPVELLSALMVSYTKAGEHEETQKCWQLAFEKSTEIARKANADTSEPGWVLHKYRFLLTLPLTRYMNSLQAMSRVDEIEPLLNSLQQAGFQLSTPNRNKYIQILAQEGRALRAFELCERELMDGWPGWAEFGRLTHAKRKIKKNWAPKSWEIGRRFPYYETLVYLAGLYLDAQGMAYGKGRELLREYKRVAPRVVEAVVKMPRFHDEIQERVLRRD